MIPDRASEFKSDNIWPLFWPKTCRKWAKSDILPIFDSFLAKKGVKYYPDLNSAARFEILSSFCIWQAPIKYEFQILIFRLYMHFLFENAC